MRHVSVLMAAAILLFGGCSSDSDGGGAGGAGNAGSGGSAASSSGGSGGNCQPECFAPYECVHSCGETPFNNGCCPCPAGTIDAYSCPDDAGAAGSSSGGAGGASGCHPDVADAGSISCGSETCTATQICVQPCCGGADAGGCTPDPPYCVERTAVECSGCDVTGSPSSNCNHAPDCFGMITGQELACICA